MKDTTAPTGGFRQGWPMTLLTQSNIFGLCRILATSKLTSQDNG